METTLDYIEKYLDFKESNDLYWELINIDWLSAVKARREQFMATEVGLEYAYGNPTFANKYISKPFTPLALKLLEKINNDYGTEYNVVFLNRYDSNRDHIGWHSDNSPEMDNNHPICVVSLGQERRILTMSKTNKDETTEHLLHSGSLFIMPKNFQTTHLHRIPKEGFDCSTRISLTFRKYVNI